MSHNLWRLQALTHELWITRVKHVSIQLMHYTEGKLPVLGLPTFFWKRYWKFNERYFFTVTGNQSILTYMFSTTSLATGKEPDYQQWQATGVRQLGWKITADNSGQYCHSYLPHLQFTPTRNCVPSGLEGSKSLSAKNSKAPFTGSYSQPISLLTTISKLMEKIAFDQIQCYFTVNKWTTNIQHAYRERHSTSTALTQMTEDWLRKNYDKIIVGAVLSDFSAAFDFIDHSVLLENVCVMASHSQI